ncbi:hypothetical protein GS399_17805 [Pedobacter sp. HMF7647]|uniref:Formyl transferase N-terminal domain-containing protein n=1 Tax=Hufsiella arboris TaxID=2695275 RepID=A0A7K1YEL5_9SPHI|nr:ankyrin repeat domain-containing protein [Hufsiella arboris]MXV52831.1 hypothetical protein [Hufsiella arboris]
MIAVEVLQYIQSNFPDLEVIAIANSTDDGVNNWQPSLRHYCKKNNIPVVQLTDVYEIANLLFLSLEFDKIIQPEFFKTDKLFNIHFSKLPAYKGMFTSILPIRNGEIETGVTLHKIDSGIDTGDIIDQQIIPINLELTARQLYEKYLQAGIDLIKKQFAALVSENRDCFTQSIIGSSYYSKKTIDFGNLKINLNKTAFEIHNQIRSLIFRDYQLPIVHDRKIYKSILLSVPTKGKPGTVDQEDDFYKVLNTIDYQVGLYVDKEDELWNAAKTGDIDQIEYLSQNGYPLNIRSKQGWDALIIACYHLQTDFVKYLLNNDWDINTANYKGTTAAMYTMTAASKTNNLELLSFILTQSPELQKPDDSGKNIFDYAVEYGNSAVIELLNSYY